MANLCLGEPNILNKAGKKNESENIPKLEKLSFKNKYSWDNAEE